MASQEFNYIPKVTKKDERHIYRCLRRGLPEKAELTAAVVKAYPDVPPDKVSFPKVTEKEVLDISNLMASTVY